MLLALQLPGFDAHGGYSGLPHHSDFHWVLLHMMFLSLGLALSTILTLPNFAFRFMKSTVVTNCFLSRDPGVLGQNMMQLVDVSFWGLLAWVSLLVACVWGWFSSTNLGLIIFCPSLGFS